MNTIKIKEIGKIKMCRRILKEQTTTNLNDIPFYKISTFGGIAENFIPKNIYEEYRHKYPYPKAGSILISAAGTIGKTVIYNGEEAYYQDSNIVWVDNDEKKILNKYLYYAFKLNNWKTTDGSTIKRLYNDNILNLDIPYIDIKNQEKITSILSLLDEKIADNGKIIEISERLMHEVYDYWFVQFDFPDENGRPYKSSGGEMVYDEKFKREIPKGWKTVELGDVIKEAKKSSVQVNEARERIGTFPFFTSGDEILDFDEYYIDGFNIFLNTGGNADIKSYYGKSAYSTDTWCISADDYSYILFIFLDSIKGQIDNNCFAGSGLKHLQKNAFKKIKLVVPEENLLTKFNELAQSSYQAISSYKSENKRLASLRDWLLPMLMNGQIKVQL